jgi:hypothetical protein
MNPTNLTKKDSDASRFAMGAMAKILLAAAALPSLGGCVQVAAPDRPIEINLNINIRQEVVVRLQGDVRELIENNPGVF